MPPDPANLSKWVAFRQQMPVTTRWAYFDHAAVAPLSGACHSAVRRWADDLAQNGDAHWKQWSDAVENARGRAARLIGADPAEIALVRNTTEGINLVSEGFPWQPGDNVVVPEDEFPSNLLPWKQLQGRGVQVREVPNPTGKLDLDRLAGLCDARTRIVAVSWVGYASGWRNDLAALAEIAHQRGARLFVDAIQGLGVFPLDVSQTPVDFLAADGHKWMLGPEGAGIFFVRREVLDVLRPIGVGWNSVQHAGDFTNREARLKPSAARYEGGSWNMPGIVGLSASLELLLDLGIVDVSERLLEITEMLCQRLESLGAQIVSDREGSHCSGIVSFDLPGQNPHDVRRRCLASHVVLSCRANHLRASPHAYCNSDDIERLIASLRGG